MPEISPNNIFDIPSGNVAGMSSVNKFGENSNVSKDVQEDIWDAGGSYTFPSTADITHISQSLADAPMQGETIEVQGLDVNKMLTIQTIDLATPTTTKVALTTPLSRIFRIKVLSDTVAAQDIVATNLSGSTTYALVQAGNNQTLMAIYTVPYGKTAYMTKYFASAVDSTNKQPTSTNIKLWTADRKNGYTFQLKHAIGIPKAGNLVEYCFSPWLKITEQTDIKLTAKSNDEPGYINAGFDLILVDNV